MTHKSRLGNIVIDCRPKVVTPAADVQIVIQQVRHESRAHLDIETDSIDSEVARLETRGAAVTSRKKEWVVMRAPTGHGFCVGKPYRAGFHEKANVWDR